MAGQELAANAARQGTSSGAVLAVFAANHGEREGAVGVDLGAREGLESNALGAGAHYVAQWWYAYAACARCVLRLP